MNTRTSAGGSLLGMLTTLVIIGILSAVAIPVWSEAVIRMRRSEAQAALQELMQQEERHFTRFNSYAAFSMNADSEYRWWSGRTASSSAYELEGKACDGQQIRDCIQLVATPGTSNVDNRFRDPQCERLILTSSGLHLATGPSRSCWR
ncbi:MULTISPECIES: type IV pilin protein [unclassified Duganella]|uniref:type IV pilin protein n=1 Tax=unclassified Duganella TaxID=2636909 RepID=UPI0006F4BA31|nr:MULTISPECIES: type IV pilin protein [unclassified Duganella]KQV46649.1 pilus assembly protein PilE [Duganella sp. Root336D2]KRC00882.1 pilus assembly protein PilE [Duganella sp. Root198D2]